MFKIHIGKTIEIISLLRPQAIHNVYYPICVERRAKRRLVMTPKGAIMLQRHKNKTMISYTRHHNRIHTFRQIYRCEPNKADIWLITCQKCLLCFINNYELARQGFLLLNINNRPVNVCVRYSMWNFRVPLNFRAKYLTLKIYISSKGISNLIQILISWQYNR